MRAILSADRKTFTLAGKDWRQTCPVEDLPQKLAFYRGLGARKGGVYLKHYQPTIAALERVAARLSEV